MMIDVVIIKSNRHIIVQYMQEIRKVINVYQTNTKLLIHTLTSIGFQTYGGTNSPFVWVHFPGRKSWDVFAEILEKTNVITIPGFGFGPAGEEFIRFSSFARPNSMQQACRRLKDHFTKN